MGNMAKFGQNNRIIKAFFILTGDLLVVHVDCINTYQTALIP